MANNEGDTPGGALLSKSQRRWLAEGGENPDTSAHNSLRMRIRTRLKQSFADFRLLSNLPDEDVRKVFADVDEEMENGMVAAFAFIYAGTRNGVGGRYDRDFETLLRRGIRKVEYDLHREELDSEHSVSVGELDIDSHISFSNPSDIAMEQIGEKIERGAWGELSEQEYAWFLTWYDDALDPYYPAREMQRSSDLREAVNERGEDIETATARSAQEHFEDRTEAIQRREDTEKGKDTDEEQ